MVFSSPTFALRTPAMNVFHALETSLSRHHDRAAFFINGMTYTYSQFTERIDAQRAWLRAHLSAEEKLVGLLGHDELDTYASIMALWAEGKAYLPLAPHAPPDRNDGIITKAGVRVLLSAREHEHPGAFTLVRTDILPSAPSLGPFVPSDATELAYVLFTSGTTGQPKGVPITRSNLQAFIEAQACMAITIGPDDRCLQMFELTFDVSVMSYVLALMNGACVHTVPQNVIKPLFIAELMEGRALTWAAMVPSVITYLRPYFDEMCYPSLKACVFAGEALPLELTAAWSACAPNARIFNAYGPTEHTIVCTKYLFRREGGNKELNGIMAIGASMGDSRLVLVDEDLRILPSGSKGELCLSGPQLTSGYWNDPERTAEVMFTTSHEGRPTRFYRTGDLCYMDDEQDIIYLGRIDQQAKIQGFRVELGEVEHYARVFLGSVNVAALAVQNEFGTTEIALCIEGPGPVPDDLIDRMRTKLPAYMIPNRVRCVRQFPLGTSGKTDRNALRTQFMATT